MWHLLEPTAETPGGIPRWGQEAGPRSEHSTEETRRFTAEEPGEGWRTEHHQEETASVTGVASDRTMRGLVLRAAKCSGAPGPGRAEGPGRTGGDVLAKLTGQDS